MGITVADRGAGAKSRRPEKNELRGRSLKGVAAEVVEDSFPSLLVLYLTDAGLSGSAKILERYLIIQHGYEHYEGVMG